MKYVQSYQQRQQNDTFGAFSFMNYITPSRYISVKNTKKMNKTVQRSKISKEISFTKTPDLWPVKLH